MIKLSGPEKEVLLAQQNSYWSFIAQFNSNNFCFLFLFLMVPELKGFTLVLEGFVFSDLSHLIPFRFLFDFPSQCHTNSSFALAGEFTARESGAKRLHPPTLVRDDKEDARRCGENMA